MSGKPVPRGALFYATSKRRREVAIDYRLAPARGRGRRRRARADRCRPRATADQRRALRQMLAARTLPARRQRPRAARGLFDADA
jgi:hypothetical protein